VVWNQIGGVASAAPFFFNPATFAIHHNYMMYIAKRDTSDDELKRHIEEELDEALEETFPASDPIEPPQPGGDEPISSPPRR